MSAKEASTVTIPVDIILVTCPSAITPSATIISVAPTTLPKCKVGVNPVHEKVDATCLGCTVPGPIPPGTPVPCVGATTTITALGTKLYVGAYVNREGDNATIAVGGGAPPNPPGGGTVTIKAGTNKPTPNKLKTTLCVFWLPIIGFIIFLTSCLI